MPLGGGQSSAPIREEVAPNQYAEWLIDEATCSTHANADQHKAEISNFLDRVVGSKRAGKLLSMDKAKAVKELAKKFAS